MNEPNPNPNPTPPQAPPADPPAPPSDNGVMIPKDRFDQVNQRMKDAEAKLAQAEADKAKADEQRLADDKKFEDLATKRATERDEWKGKAETAEGRVAALEARLHAVADARVEELPEPLRERVPAADQAPADARLDKVEELQAVLSVVPNAAPSPGLGRTPRPAGAPSPAAALEARKRELRQSGGYGRF